MKGENSLRRRGNADNRKIERETRKARMERVVMVVKHTQRQRQTLLDCGDEPYPCPKAGLEHFNSMRSC